MSPQGLIEAHGPRLSRTALALCLMVGSAACERATRPDLDDPVGRTSLTDANLVAAYPGRRAAVEGTLDRGAEEALRTAVLEDETLSPTAKSVTVITVDNTLVLQGRVENERERETLVAKAEDAADGPVREQLVLAHP